MLFFMKLGIADAKRSPFSFHADIFANNRKGENLGAKKKVKVSIKWFNGPWKPEERLGCHGSLLKEAYRAGIMSFHRCLVLYPSLLQF